MEKKNLQNLRIAICQMNVICNQPKANADYMISEIAKAAASGCDLIVFPEMCISGYVIGDIYENQSFAIDVEFHNERIRKATTGLSIAVIFGSFERHKNLIGEDGRPRMYNLAFVAQNGEWKGKHVKFLHPNYGVFDDSRHWLSGAKILQGREAGQNDDMPTAQTIRIETSFGELNLGVMVCEDMWHETYAFNPGKMLVDAGAEILINISASPWSWRKNTRRHQVIARLINYCRVPFIYVNNTGMQNNGKNLIIFDGSSTVYDEDGVPVSKIGAYEEGTHSFKLRECSMINVDEEEDVKQLYDALICGIREFWKLLPPQSRKVHIGLSGGIDSAVVTALMVRAVGKENVFTYNMPSRYNSAETKDIARTIASNLGVSYRVISIEKMVEAAMETLDCQPGTLTYQNVQARTRLQVLATMAQHNGGIFTSNGNKTETAFGYATLYGDIGGWLSVIGDLVKREVYQIGAYCNQLFGTMVIPQSCFDIAPSAELETKQIDPFDYGSLTRRGYHDEFVRAVTLFRKDAEWFLDEYKKGTLEKTMKLEVGTLERLFASEEHFVSDLEKNWRSIGINYFKRVQGPPNILVSMRGFGFDLRESIVQPYFTNGFEELKDHIEKGAAA